MTITKSGLQTLDYSYLGEPFVRVAAKSTIDLDTLDYSYLGEPFWGVGDEGDSIYPTVTTISAIDILYTEATFRGSVVIPEGFGA